MSLAPGTRIGPYEIIDCLGAGGMGEVYRARDRRLARDVAIKILPDMFTSDRDRLERFEREARLLAALAHPHIAAIYGMEDVDGVRGLVLELVDGPTLSERIGWSGGLPVGDAVAIARQLVDALEAAHERGIIHRDLKPANIKLTADGQVKVLDFGLAKAMVSEPAAAAAADSPTVTVGGTRDGIILGTAAYMSPEQARGTPVDKRTDIWSFGCVLYEMLTGRLAFGGASVSDSIAAILTREPDWSALPPATPLPLRRLLRRCLDKDRRKRLRDIGDARTEIDEATAPLAEGGNPVAISLPPLAERPGSRWWPWTLAGLVAGGAATLAVMTATMPPTSGDALARGAVERLTRDEGLTWMPALSPDGKLIAYSSDRSGRGDLDIWVQQSAAGAPFRLTDDEFDDWMPAFSPDGSQVAFRSERAGGGIYAVPTLGGTARLLAADGRAPRFSPDGSRLAFWTGQFRGTPSSLASAAFVMPLSGTPTRLLPDFVTARDPIWSPDGRSLIVLGRRDAKAPLAESYDWWWVPLDGRPPTKTGLLDMLNFRQATEQEGMDVGLWTEDGLLAATPDTTWLVPLSPASGRVDGAPRRLTLGAGRVSSPTMSRDGQIAFAVMQSTRSIERIPMSGDGRPVRLYSDVAGAIGRPSQTADGSTLVFEQFFGSSKEIWLKDSSSGQLRMVSSVESALGVDPVISNDARRVAYTVNAAPDQGTGFSISTSGGVPTKICDSCGVHGFLSDGRRVLVVDGDRHAIRAVDVTTGISEEVIHTTESQIDRPHASADDRWLAFRSVKGSAAKTYVTALKPGAPASATSWRQIDEPTITGRPAGWSLDSGTVYLLLDTDGFRCLWAQRIDPGSGALVGPVKASLHLHQVGGGPVGGAPGPTYGNAISRDGFLYGTRRITSNIWRLIPAAPRAR